MAVEGAVVEVEEAGAAGANNRILLAGGEAVIGVGSSGGADLEALTSECAILSNTILCR